ncbi:hypothetical protein VME_45590 [Vibrio harveyi 1DA3]|nr:hypothetical protein VME_45590 [Vibrio harveyi 1DA3]
MKHLVILLSLSVSAISAYLTFQFAATLSLALGVMGIALDATKSILPLLAMRAYHQGFRPVAIIMALTFCVLTVVSFGASYGAFENGTNQAIAESNVNSNHYQAITLQIEQLEKQANKLREINHVTKAGKIDSQILELLSNRAKLESVETSDVLAHESALVLAAAIELCSLVLMLGVSVVTHQDTAGHDETPNETSLIPTVDKPITIVTTDDKEQQIRAAIIAQAVTPSVRGVRKQFNGIGNDRISAILKELGEAGILKQNGKGWMYS